MSLLTKALDGNRLGAAFITAERNYAKKHACPRCKQHSAILALSFRSVRVATLCRFCDFVAYHGAAAPARGLYQNAGHTSRTGSQCRPTPAPHVTGTRS